MADDIRKMIEKLEREKAEIETALKVLRREVGMSPKAPPLTGKEKGESALPEIIPGEFYGLSQTEAGSKLLKKVGRPLTTNEIIDMLKRSGYEFKSQNPAILYRALHRSKDFVKVKRNTWGLAEWYPAKKEKEQARKEKAQPEGQSLAGSKGGEKKESD